MPSWPASHTRIERLPSPVVPALEPPPTDASPEARRLWLLALTLYWLAWAVLSWPWLSGAVTIPWDAKAHFYPQLQFLAQSINRGEWPFWTPYVFSGSPQIADPQSLIFSPPFLLLAALDRDPGFQAFDAVVLGMLGLGGTFVMLLFRDRGWHPLGALVAALAFAFGASAAWRIQHVGQILSLAYAPIVLWLLLRALRRRSLPYGLVAGIAAGILALGRDQVAYLALWLLVGTVAVHWRRAGLRGTAGPLVAGTLAGALVIGVPLLLTLFLAEASNRPAIPYSDAARGSVHSALLLTALIPNLFGVDGPFLDYWGPPSPRWGETDLVLARNMGVVYAGALPFALLVAGAAKGVLWAREIRPVTVAFGLMLAYALGPATPVLHIAFELLPGASLFRRPADGLFLAGAVAACLSGYLAHRVASGTFLRDGLPWGVPELLFALALFASAVVLAETRSMLDQASRPIVEAALELAIALALLSVLPGLGRRPEVALVLVALLLAADLFWNNGPNESTALPPDRYEVLRPDSRNALLAALTRRLRQDDLDRVELTGLGFHWPNASLIHRLHNVLGYNPVRLALYAQATGAGDHVALPEQRTFSPLFPSYRSTLADMLGLRYVLTGVPIERIDPKLRPGDLIALAETRDGFLYENPRAWPRVFFAIRAQPVEVAVLLRDGRWPDADLRTTVLVPEVHEGDAAPSAPPEPSTVTVAAYADTEVLIDVDARSAGHVVLNDPYHPWWIAELDGREVPILQANGIFRAVAVGPGAHRIRFVFRPLRGAWREATARLAALRSGSDCRPRDNRDPGTPEVRSCSR